MIGAVIVGYQSGDVIGPCIRSLLASSGTAVRIVVCDNASSDDTIDVVRSVAAEADLPVAEWPADKVGALGPEDLGQITLIRSPVNLGFAGAVNLGLRVLLADPGVSLFWLLNPDGVATPGAAAAYLRAAEEGPFGLMGGRTLYHDPPNHIQSDGGRVSAWTGMCGNVNLGRLPDEVTMPDASAIDYISGANLVASRAFVEQVGLMTEDYFLYYEEVDWAARRGDLPLRLCPDALVLHHVGTSIGSATTARRASAFANYFNFRNRMRFMRRFHPVRLPVAYAYSMAKIASLVVKGAWSEAEGAFRGMHGLAPPDAVKDRIAPEARRLAFGRAAR
jgi:GT2 family glycosyltransferase